MEGQFPGVGAGDEGSMGGLSSYSFTESICLSSSSPLPAFVSTPIVPWASSTFVFTF